MQKSERLANKLGQAEILIEKARCLVAQVIDEDENGDGDSAGAFMKTADDLVDLIGDLSYEICMPLEMQEEEEERLAEIACLEARLKELKGCACL